MKETSIARDPAVLERLYQRFDYLQDLPCDIRGCLIDRAINLGVLETDSFLAFLMAYEIEEQKASRDHFAFLSVEDNLKINRYCHFRPVEPWPQPIIGVSFSGDRQTGRTTGTHKVDVILNNVGEAQLYWGAGVAVIWEAFVHDRVESIIEFEALMHQLWHLLEQYLHAQGVEQVFTDARDPEFEHMGNWYRNFLTGRGYQVLEQDRIKREVLRKVV